MQFALVGSNGFAYGTAGPTQANNSVSGALVQFYPKNASLPLPDRTVIDFTGGNRWLGAYQYGITSLGSMAATFDNVDADLVAMLSGSSVDQTTTSAWTIFSENVLALSIPQVAVLVTFQLQGRGAQEGGDFFITGVIGRSWAAPKGFTNAPNFQSAGEYNVQITPTSTNVFPHGVPFGTNQDWQGNATPLLWIISERPIHLATFVGNNAATTFTLPYLPLDSTVTQNASRTQVAVAGTTTAPSSINTSTGVITMSAAPGSGVHVGVLYETNFVVSPP